MNYRALDGVIPIIVYEGGTEELPDLTLTKKIGEYKSILKGELYLGISSKTLKKLVHSAHRNPYWCKKLGKYIIVRKQ